MISAKRKVQKVINKIEGGVATSYGIDVDQLQVIPKTNKNDATKAADLDNLTLLMKEKINISTYKHRIQILTLSPDSWSRKFGSQYFSVSEHSIRKARQLKIENGILLMPSNRIGKTLSTDIIKLVQNIYQDDEYSRLMPGKKYCISIGKGIHAQKRLILCNLRELYSAFEDVNPEVSIGFSKFCCLCPKWCITVGAKGTHSVCVCIHHQNAVLLLSAIKWDVTYKDLMAKVSYVSDINLL